MVSAQKILSALGVGAKYAFRKMLNLPVTAYTSRRSNNVLTAFKTLSRRARCYCTAPTARTRRACDAHSVAYSVIQALIAFNLFYFNISYFVKHSFANVAIQLDCLKHYFSVYNHTELAKCLVTQIFDVVNIKQPF